jgi:hypothetical protein
MCKRRSAGRWPAQQKPNNDRPARCSEHRSIANMICTISTAYIIIYSLNHDYYSMVCAIEGDRDVIETAPDQRQPHRRARSACGRGG